MAASLPYPAYATGTLMSHTLALHPVKKRDAIFLWVLFGWLAFALLPSWSLDYGLLESTSDEILAAYGWSQFNSAGCGICYRACC